MSISERINNMDVEATMWQLHDYIPENRQLDFRLLCRLANKGKRIWDLQHGNWWQRLAHYWINALIE